MVLIFTIVKSFATDLAEAFVSCDIPLKKLRMTKLRNFFEKYTNNIVASESTLCEKCVPELFKETMESIRAALLNKFVWISMDETVDFRKSCVINVEENGRRFLIKTEIASEVNHRNIARIFTDLLDEFLADLPKDKVHIFVIWWRLEDC